MIVDVIQRPTSVEFSYITNKGGIDVLGFKIADMPNMFPIWYKTADGKVNKEFQNVVDIQGNPVELRYANRFNRWSLIEYMHNMNEHNAALLFNDSVQPLLSAFDIEVEIGDEFPSADVADQRVSSIATSSPTTLATVVQVIYELTPEQCTEVANIANDWLLKFKVIKEPINVSVIQHANERDMLHMFVTKIWRNVAGLIGWNTWGYDFPYLKNRCAKLGVDLSLASITNRLSYTGYPEHKIHEDYLDLTKSYDYSVGRPPSYRLDVIADIILGIPKLEYEGSLKQLYANDKVRYTAYNVIDTVLVQLIHRKQNSTNALYAMSNAAKLPYNEAKGAVAQGEHAIFNFMLNEQSKLAADQQRIVFAADTDFGKIVPYEGGFVKSPPRNYGDFIACFDFSSLYPSIKRTHNYSPELFIKKLTDKQEMLEYMKNPDFTVSWQGCLYDNTKDGIYKRVQSDYYVKRKSYQKRQFDMIEAAELVKREQLKRGLIDHM